MFKNRVLHNASWIVRCKIIQSLISLIIGMITARYLEPSGYGLVSYAASLVAFFQPIVKLGFDSTLVQEIVSSQEQEGKILGTSLGLSIIASVAAVIGVTSFALLANEGETETIIVCLLYSLLLIFQACEMTLYWFQAKLLSKYSSLVSLIAYILVAFYKICILVMQRGVRWFAVSHVIEVAIIAILLLVTYRKMGGRRLTFSFALGWEMLGRSKYYILAGMMVVVFQQTDRIMLKLLLGDAETGYYSAAQTCVGVTAFIFGAIIDSARPPILEAHKESLQIFERRMVLLFSTITYLSLAQSLCVLILARPLVLLLYGKAYANSINVLRVMIWYVAFGYYGTIRNIWILAEGKQKWLIIINLIGAIVNVVGNLLFIPVWGANGAAATTVATQIITNFILCAIIKDMRPVWKLTIQSMNPKWLLQYANTILKKHDADK